MNCEQVEGLLSAYLDDTLAVEEEFATTALLKSAITTHLERCYHCSTVLADYQRFDHLLVHMPRVSPAPQLREKIFCSEEYLKLTGTGDGGIPSRRERTIFSSYQQTRRDTGTPPYLIALPGGKVKRGDGRERFDMDKVDAPTRLNPVVHMQEGGGRRLRLLQMAVVVVALLTLVVGGMIGWNVWQQQNALTQSSGGITPPEGLSDHGPFPLPAGMRSVFLRDGTLWSAPADGSAGTERLTSSSITVAPNWVVSPALPGHSAGDRLAYIDIQRGLVHTVRSDGQEDMTLAQPLLKAGIQPASAWRTSAGVAILHSLAWSKDGAMLAFVAAPDGTGATNLYLYTRETGRLQTVDLPVTGVISTPTWSPDGKRLAFALTEHGNISLFDYNSENHGLLLIANSLNSGSNGLDTLLSLDWSPNEKAPAITWSVGETGHVHSIWLRHVGVGGDENSQMLAEGDFAQAVYSDRGNNGMGSWLLVALNNGHEGNLWRIDAASGAYLVNLTNGKQIDVVGWSPDGSRIDYVDEDAPGAGTLHVVQVSTTADEIIAESVKSLPAPVWSADGLKLLYSTGTAAMVVDVRTGRQSQPLPLAGNAVAFTWFPESETEFLVRLSDEKQGLYLVDTQRHSTLLVEQQVSNGAIGWTEIP